MLAGWDIFLSNMATNAEASLSEVMVTNEEENMKTSENMETNEEESPKTPENMATDEEEILEMPENMVTNEEKSSKKSEKSKNMATNEEESLKTSEKSKSTPTNQKESLKTSEKSKSTPTNPKESSKTSEKSKSTPTNSKESLKTSERSKSMSTNPKENLKTSEKSKNTSTNPKEGSKTSENVATDEDEILKQKVLKLKTRLADLTTPKDKGRNNKRKVLSLRERVKVLEMSLAGQSSRKIAADFGVGKTQIQYIVRDKDSILKEWNEGGNMQKKYSKKRKTPYEELNGRLWQWYCEARFRNIPVTGKLMQEKALLIALEQGQYSFSASNGWLESFNKRNNISLCSSSAKITISDIIENVEDWQERLKTICKGYEEGDIFSADETCLFYRAVPQKSVEDIGEKNNEELIKKEKLTMLLCCSATGEKLEPFYVGKQKEPKCFRGRPVIGMYAANKEALMNCNLFHMWLTKLNNELTLHNRKILLFVDRCSAHPDVSLSNVKLVFFPPNITTDIQPCTVGIIRAVKAMYKKRLLTHILFHMDNDASKIAKKVNLLDAISWFNVAWGDLPCETIVKCFKNCGFIPKDSAEDTELEEEDEISGEMAGLMVGTSWEEYVTMDDAVPSTASMGDNWEEEILGIPADEEIAETTEEEETAEEETVAEEEIEDEPLPEIISCRVASSHLDEVKQFALVHDNQELLELVTKSQQVLEASNLLAMEKAKNKLVDEDSPS